MKNPIGKPMKNMIYHFMKGFLLITTLIFVTSCEVLDLDEKPKSFVSPESFYTSSDQIEAALAGAMKRLFTEWGGYSRPAQWAQVHTDQTYVYFIPGDLNITGAYTDGLWEDHYAAINDLNNVIKALEEGIEAIPQDEVDEWMGQAKFLRAFNYFMLVRMFGGLPLITEDTPDPLQAEIGRSSIAEVYELIIEDFTEAIAKLPPTWPSEYRGRPTMDVAKGLLAKAYLTMATAPLNEVSNYQKAADLAKEVIDGGRYSLVQDIDRVFSLETKYGPEMMWSFNTNYPDKVTAPQVYIPIMMEGWSDITVEPDWEQQFPDQPRKEAYLLTEIDGVPYSEWPVSPTPGIKKLMQNSPEDIATNTNIMNLPILRYADVLLIFAEAENMANGGPTQAAVDAVNQVIDRANGYVNNPSYPRLTTSMSMEEFDAAVIRERNLELSFELDRWFDLVRKRMLGEVNQEHAANYQPECDYLFPIPETDIELNPLLEQNPCY